MTVSYRQTLRQILCIMAAVCCQSKSDTQTISTSLNQVVYLQCTLIFYYLMTGLAIEEDLNRDIFFMMDQVAQDF